MKKEHEQKLHILLLIGAFAIGLAFRLIRLGVPALSDFEAEIALKALGVARGSEIQFGPHVAYVGLTGFSFSVLSSSNFLARFWSALIGALIVFIPFLFREKIGHWPAMILSFILAISPEMVGLSRLIGSPMMSLVMLLLALGFVYHQKPILTGICLAVGLMSSQGFWMGGFILGCSYVLARWLFKVSEIFDLPSIANKRSFWLRLGLSFLATLLLVGTGFFLSPGNVSGTLSGFISFIRGFITSDRAPFMVKPLTLVAYAGGAVVFGIWGSLRGILSRNKMDLFLLCWWVVGLAFVLLYPSGAPVDMVWVTLPLWILSARVVFPVLQLPEKSRFVMVVTIVLVVVVAAFMLFAMRTLVSKSDGDSSTLNTFLALIGGIVLLIVIVLLVNYGWSEKIALPGLIFGLVIVFTAGLISVSVNSTGLAPESSYEIWYPNEAVLSPKWLGVSIERITEWNAVSQNRLEIAISDFDTPGMRWFLRDGDPVYFLSYLSPQSEPAMLITNAQEMPGISSGYRGQDLIWSRMAAWEAMTPYDYLKWLMTRVAPTYSKEIVFWVRTDLMLDEDYSN